jgi:prepilin-type N-terminal cleavage/methylation domain-containing protein
MRQKYKKGFTLIEVVVAVAIAAILCAGVYGIFTAVFEGITYYRESVTVSSLAQHYLEVARNLAYSKIGTKLGNPNGNLPDLKNPLNINFNNTDYQIYYVVNALHDPADPNPTVQDYKQIKLYIKNKNTGATKSFVTTVAPITLASMGNGGALSIQVISSMHSGGQPVQGAVVNIKNTYLNPEIDLTRLTDNNGRWSEVGLPPDSHYHITISKNGYSSDQTYSTEDYPETTRPDSNIILNQTQNETFIIDKLSNLAILAQNQSCQPLQNININVAGAKTISPGLPKFNKSYYTNANGFIYPANTTQCSSTCGSANCCLEWDTYTPSLASSEYMVYGTSPVQSTDLLPDTSQSFSLILGPKTNNSLLVVVKDQAGNPVESATVKLINSSLGYENIKYTGGSIWNQNNWSGGSGQMNFSDAAKYGQDDGNITTDIVPLALRLKEFSGQYVSFGTLTSSTFDTGTDQTSYTILDWQASQDPQVSVKFQIATSDEIHDEEEDTFWHQAQNYTGPDGTSGTFYTVPKTTIHLNNNGKRYIRYKVFLSTENPEKTPQLSNVSINYVSGCPTPGQVIFTGLTANNNYTATINGLQTFENLDIQGYFILQTTLEE